MNLVQKEAEKCDRLSGFLTLLSMAGGTGSGLGAFVTRSLRDAYPSSFLLNHIIWPYSLGEVNGVALWKSGKLQTFSCGISLFVCPFFFLVYISLGHEILFNHRNEKVKTLWENCCFAKQNTFMCFCLVSHKCVPHWMAPIPSDS